MSKEMIELTQSQMDRLDKVDAITRKQVDAAVKIAEEKFASYEVANRMRFLAAIIQAQATNYLAEVTRTSGKN